MVLSFFPNYFEQLGNFFRQKFFWLINLVPRVLSFYIGPKFILKNCVITVHLLQCRTYFFIHYVFEGEIYRKLEKIHLRKHPLITKKRFFWFVYTRLHILNTYEIYFILSMKSTKMNDNSESISQTASKPVLISKYDPVTFAEVVIVVCCFEQIKFRQRTFFRFRAFKIYFGT